MGGSRLCINIYKNKTARMCISNREQKYREADSRLILYFFHVCENFCVRFNLEQDLPINLENSVSHIGSPRQQPPTDNTRFFLVPGLVLCFVELQLTVLPVKMCFKTWYMLLLQVKSSNTGFEQRHNLSLKLNFPFRPVISRRRSRVET